MQTGEKKDKAIQGMTLTAAAEQINIEVTERSDIVSFDNDKEVHYKGLCGAAAFSSDAEWCSH